MSKALIIDKEFKSLIPPLTPEEFNQLEQNCLKDGILESIKVWNDVIIDGHNRHEIASKNGLDFTVTELNFENRTNAIEWIILHQLGRRNLTEEQKAYLRGKRYENEKLKVGTRTDLVQDLDKVSTKEKLAVEYNVSKNTILNDADFAKGIDLLPEERKTEVLSGKSDLKKQEVQQIGKIRQQVEKQVNADAVMRTDEDIQAEIEVKARELAAKEIRRIEEEKRQKKEQKVEQRKIEIQAQKDAIASGEMKLPEGVFEVIAIDPPWNYGREYDPDGSRVANPYPEMNQEQLLKLNPPFAENSVCFLWTTHAFIFDAKALLDKWGFTYKATIVWDKEKIGMGAWLRMQCEFCLVGIKGKPMWNNTKYRDIIREPRREHSRKPDAFYEMVQEITIGRRLEYFSRENREGWEVFGNDTQKF
ncbi:MAG: MT-A70 family methyltransferase [Candidatus Riflebacteria bacterium]|nr:MT-A70 family methyltransferase [Candidatus Riflebacteria bacterium]